ncbi:MAG: hypothetical protein O3C40_29700, partial [Planctomycetota bacterium]|nr:hypothetical protein [Planctomycetota bacterium]
SFFTGILLHWHPSSRASFFTGILLHGHPHIHVLVTRGALTPEGDFLELPEFDLERLLATWPDAVFALYLAEEKIEPEVVENMRSCPGTVAQRWSAASAWTSRCFFRRAISRVSSRVGCVKRSGRGNGDRSTCPRFLFTYFVDLAFLRP